MRFLKSAQAGNITLVSCLIASLSACGGGVFEKRQPKDLSMTVCDTGKEGYKIIGEACQPVFPPELIAKNFTWEIDEGVFVPVLKLKFDRKISFQQSQREVGLGLSSDEVGGVEKLELFKQSPDSFEDNVMQVRVPKGMQGNYQLTLPALKDQYGNVKVGGIIELNDIDTKRPVLETAAVEFEENSKPGKIFLEFSEDLLFTNMYLYILENESDTKPTKVYELNVVPGLSKYEASFGSESVAGYYYLVVLEGKDQKNNPYAGQNKLVHIQEEIKD